MKQGLTILVIGAFVAIAVFGFFGMGGHSGGHASCIASVGQATVCSHEGVLAAVAFHGQFFKRLTSAFSGNELIILAMLFLASLVWFLVAQQKILIDSHPLVPVSFRTYLAILSARVRYVFLGWLSLHERVGPALA